MSMRESSCLVTLSLRSVRYVNERIQLSCYSATAFYVMSMRESSCLVTLSLRSVRYVNGRVQLSWYSVTALCTLCEWENPVVLLLCHCALYVMSMRESSCLVTLSLRSVRYVNERIQLSCYSATALCTLCEWENPVVLLLCHCALYVMWMRESSCLVTLSLRSVRYVNERIQLSCYSATAFYVMPMHAKATYFVIIF